MRTLIVEDDFISRRLLQRMLEPLGDVDIAVNGQEAMDAFRSARREGSPYDLICLDIMMPVMDGHEVLRQIRQTEQEAGLVGAAAAKVIMTTVLGDYANVMKAFSGQCEAYLRKPVDKQRLYENLAKLGFHLEPAPGQDGPGDG